MRATDSRLPRQGRGRELLYALNAAAASLQRSAHSEPEVYRAFQEQIAGLGLRGGLSLLDDTGQHLVVRAITQPQPLQGVMAQLETLVGLKAEGYTVRVDSADVYRQVIETGEAVFVPDASALVAQLIPETARRLARLIVRAFGTAPGILAPLTLDGQIRGVLNIAGAGLTRDDVPAFEAFAHHLSVALGNARLFGALQHALQQAKESQEEFRRRDAILEAVAFAAERFLKDSSWQDSIQAVLERLGQATGVSRAYIFENQAQADGTLLTSQRYEWAAPGIATQIDNPDLQNFPLRAAGFGRWVETLGQGRLIHGNLRSFPDEEREILDAQSIRSMVVVPIFAGQDWWGFIGFDECLAEREWSAAETDALKTAATTLGEAIQRQRADRALRQSEERYRTIFQTAAVAIWEEDFSEVMAAIDDLRAQGVTDLACYLDEHPEFVRQAAALVSVRDVNEAAIRMLGAGDKAELLGSLGKIIAPETLAILRDEIVAIAEGRPHFEGETINHTLQGAPFNVLLTMAIPPEREQLDSVLVSIMDITERKRAEETLRESEERFRRTLDNMLEGCQIIDFNWRFLYVNDAVARHGRRTRDELLGRTLMEVYPGIQDTNMFAVLRRCMDERTPNHMENEFTYPDGSARWFELGMQPVSEGVFILSIDITERKQAEEQIRRNAARAEALARTAARLNAQLGLNEVLSTVCEETALALNVPVVNVGLYDEPRDVLYLAAQIGMPSEFLQRTQPWPRALYDEYVRQAGPLIVVPDVQAIPGLPNADVMARVNMRTTVNASMLREGNLVGSLNIATLGEPRHFTDDELALLQGLADQAALAITNARLFEETRRRSDEFAALHATARDLAEQYDLPGLLRTVVRHAMTLLGAPCAGMYLYDGANSDLELVVAVGFSAPLGTRLALGEGMAGHVAQTRQALIVDDYRTWAGRSAQYAGVAFTAVLEVPMLCGGELIGVLAVNEVAEITRKFTEEDARLLSLFAGQAASAVHSARLLSETLHRADEFAALYKIAHDLAAQQDSPVLLQTIADSAVGLLAASGGAIYLYDPARGDLVIAVVSGQAVPLGARLQPGEGMAGRVAQTRQPLMVDDYSTWEHRSPQFESMPINAVVGVPMLYGGELIGVLVVNVFADRTRKFTEADVRLLSLFAGQAANVVNNARLYAETRRRLAELEAVNRVSTAMRAAQTLDEMLPLLLDETLAVLGTDTGAIWLHDESGADELRPVVSRGWHSLMGDEPTRPGEGIAGTVFATGLAHISRDFEADPLTNELARPLIPAGWGGACVPIRTGRQIVGVVFVSVRVPRAVTADEVNLLTTLAEIAGNAIHRMRLHAQTERRLRRLTALSAIDLAIASSFDLRVTLNILLEQVTVQLRVDAVDILLLNPHIHTLEYAAGRGFRSRAIERSYVHLGEGYAGRAALERRTVYLPDLSEEEPDFSRAPLLAGEDFQAYSGAPLVVKGLVQGVLEIYHRAPLQPDPEWLDFLESLAGQAAIALESAQLFDGLQRANLELALAYDTTIEGWSRALDLRDRETEGHTLRVTETTLRLARAMGVGEAELVHIRRGALLHDIGKMGIPDNLLHKLGPLSDGEWEIMRRHPTYAFELLSPIAYLRPALDIPYCHHEKWDGTGYPRGLKGEQIPLAARIFAVTDVWDALRSDRPYRAAWPAEAVRAYIRAQVGLHFDRRAAEEFLTLLDQEQQSAPYADLVDTARSHEGRARMVIPRVKSAA